MKRQENGPSEKTSAQDAELGRLMASAQAGNREDYVRLLKGLEIRLGVFVRNTFRRWGLGPDEREDVVQEILIAIHDKRRTYDPSQPFLPWVFAIAHYKSVDHLRKLQSRRTRSEELPEDFADPGAAPDDADRLDWEVLASQLPAKQRELIELVKIEGLSVQEASQRTGYSNSDVKVSVHRAMRSLQAWVKGERK